MSYLGVAFLKYNSKIKLSVGDQQKKKDLEERFIIPNLNNINKWYSNFPNENILFKWTNDFYITGKENLYTCLEGYRFIIHNEKWVDLTEINKWDRNWIIIATYNADPVIANIGQENIPIYYDFVGGDFSPTLLVDSLEKLDYFLAIWLKYHEDKYYQKGEYPPTFFDSMIKEWNKKLSKEEINIICEFFSIRKSDSEFLPNENKVIKVQKYTVFLDNLGKDRQKVLLEIRKETGLSFTEIRNKLKEESFIISEGYGENTLMIAEYFRTLGALVRVEVE